jgi:anti-anti-sigma regulatory factor
MPAIRMEPEHAVQTRNEGEGVVLTIQGCLDQGTAEALVAAASHAVEGGPARLEIDLCSLTGFTDEGAGALAACRELCTDVPEGLHYKTGQGPGRAALLAAYADR